MNLPCITKDNSLYQCTYRAPSNIALVKYWGKKEEQLAINASLSMTLKNCYTQTQIVFYPENTNADMIQVYLDEKLNPSFVPKIAKAIRSIESYWNITFPYKLKIFTFNTFPHSAGIASSASSMAALVLGLMDGLKHLGVVVKYTTEDLSCLARLASGSACRSLFSHYVLWGKLGEEGHEEYATALCHVHPDMLSMQDAILVVDQGIKNVSSSRGHESMIDHAFKQARIEMAKEHAQKMLKALETNDMDSFGYLLEKDALALHALMLSADEPFILLRPNSLAIIEAIWKFRKETGAKVYFTIDAGPNIHVLYQKHEKDLVEKLLTKLAQELELEKIIWDEIGLGPIKVNCE